MSEPFSDRLFGMFSGSMKEVSRKYGKTIKMNVIVERTERNSYIYAFLAEHLSGSIEGEFMFEDKFIKLSHKSIIIGNFKRRTMRRSYEFAFIDSTVS